MYWLKLQGTWGDGSSAVSYVNLAHVVRFDRGAFVNPGDGKTYPGMIVIDNGGVCYLAGQGFDNLSATIDRWIEYVERGR